MIHNRLSAIVQAGLYGALSREPEGTPSLVRGVLQGQPSSLCSPPSLDPCTNSVNPFAPNLDCYNALEVVEIAETSGVDPASLAIGDHNNDPKSFSQLVPGTYLVKDIKSEAWATEIENVGDTDSCMRIQGRAGGSHEDFFIDLSCSTTEGVSAILSFDCPHVGLCSVREGNEFSPALLVIQGVLKVVDASEAECIGLDAQIELTGTGLVDEAISARARFANYTGEQRITLFGEGEETELITTRGIALVSPAASSPLGLLTFPTAVPSGCPSLLNQRIFTITSGDVAAGGVIAATASGFSYDQNDNVVSKKVFEVEEGSGKSAEDFNRACRVAAAEDRIPAEQERLVAEQVAIGADPSRALVGIEAPSLWFPLFKTGQSPAFPLFNARTVARFSVIRVFEPREIADEFGVNDTRSKIFLWKDRLDKLQTTGPTLSFVQILCAENVTVLPLTFKLENLETGSSLDLILKGRLTYLLDQEAGVYVDCRGLVLQTLPAGFSKPYVFPGGLEAGSIAAVGVDPEFGTLGDTVFVDVLIEETDGSTTSLRDEGVVANLSQHNCMGANQTEQRQVDATVLVYERQDDGNRTSDDVILNTACKIGFECFAACPEPRLPVAISTAVQPGTYQLLDADFISVESLYTIIGGKRPAPRRDSFGCLSMFEYRESEGCIKKGYNDSTCTVVVDERIYSCEPDQARGTGVQLKVEYEPAALNGSLTKGFFKPSTLANVVIKGAVYQTEPSECAGSIVFVEGTLLVAVGFQNSFQGGGFGDEVNTKLFGLDNAEGLQLGIPEALLTSSVRLMDIEYTLLSLAEHGNATVERCFNANLSTTISTKDIVSAPEGSDEDAYFALFDVYLADRAFDGAYRFSPGRDAGAPQLSDDQLGLRLLSQIGTRTVNSNFIQDAAVLLGRLASFCNKTNEVMIQCQRSKRLQLMADGDPLAVDDDLVHSIATVVSSGAGPVNIGSLTAPPMFTLSCNTSEAGEIVKLSNTGIIGIVYDFHLYQPTQHYLIRTVPLSAEFARSDGEKAKVEALCPVAIDCMLPERAPRPSSLAINDTSKGGSSVLSPSADAAGNAAAMRHTDESCLGSEVWRVL
ncbi:unnamed protein product [Vitrella brassicaformis CCMP3155]|uniref:Uncharacterized protein n=1 Tax=Vitrella brassicaformis (strain CCMP3155) TaxID=1169540 RepID=A0A0G4FFH0_VITBC|nr:unnamed protein product [Vitrella brassicaformis CCMP3155]|eukprot:CEM11936.1 unnamed protein product [Vitrella brassicaformis CCMP3155]